MCKTRCFFAVLPRLVPPAMLPKDADKNQSVFSSDDADAFRTALGHGLTCWIHGSSSACIKSAMRDRYFSNCFVSDVVRSDSGLVANPCKALSAPLGALSSDIFCRSIQSVRVLERAGGWKDDRQQSESTYLYVFRCQPPAARSQEGQP